MRDDMYTLPTAALMLNVNKIGTHLGDVLARMITP